MERSNTEKILKDFNVRDKAAFGHIFQSYYSGLCHFSDRILRDEEAARDVVQEVFITMWEKFIRFENLTTLRFYLYMNVRRKSLSYLDKMHNRRRIVLSLPIESANDPDYLSLLVESEVLRIIHSAVNSLPPECRRIFKLSYYEQMELRDISELLGIAVSTVKTQRSRGKQLLRERLERYRFQLGNAL